MPRYRHMLTRGKGDSQPARIVGLACDTSAERTPVDPLRAVEQLERWHTAGYARDSKGKETVWESSGQTADGFWGAVDYALKRGGQTWVVSWQATRWWGLLGLWPMIERKEIVLHGGHETGTDSTGEGHSVPGVQESAAGADASAERARNVPGPGLLPVPGVLSPENGAVRALRVASEGCVVLEDPPTVIRFRRPGLPGSVLVVDALNWGIERPADWTEAGVQARQARELLRRMIDTLRSEQWGSLRATSGAQAWGIWRRAYADQTVSIHCNPDALALEGAAYVGGRCECRFIGRYPGVVYHVDFRSLYPSICAWAELPALFEDISALEGSRPGDLANGNVLRIAQTLLRTTEPAYPYQRDGETYYPTGRFRTVLCGPELDDALANGRVLEVGRVATYRGNFALRSYSLGLWAVLQRLRASGDKQLAQWIKRMLVSLPGKCGQRGFRWTPRKPGNNDPLWGQWWEGQEDGTLTRCRAIGGFTEMEVREPWAPESIPSIAAWVTSAGRLALLNSIRAAGWRNVLYYDTDSLIVNEEGWQRLQSSQLIKEDTLGSLRLMGRHEECEIIGIKHYTLDGKRTCAGMPKGIAMPSSVPGAFWYQERAKDALYERHRPAVEWVLKEYARDEAYRHGIVREDGRVDPLHVEET